jgi:transcriptional regulatory protein RtcR
MAPGGRINREVVDQEIERLQIGWQAGEGSDSEVVLEEVLGLRSADVDLFDRFQLARVIEVCRSSRNLSDAGRKLYAVSRLKKAIPNDGDRLRKYLGRFGLNFGDIV